MSKNNVHIRFADAVYDKLIAYAREHGLSIKAAAAVIITRHFDDRSGHSLVTQSLQSKKLQ